MMVPSSAVNCAGKIMAAACCLGAYSGGLLTRAIGTREMRQAIKPVRTRGGSYAEGACACGYAVGAEAERTRTAVLYEFVSPLDEYCGPRGTNQRRCRTAAKCGTAAQNFFPVHSTSPSDPTMTCRTQSELLSIQ
jgi:hypothetical protein